MAQDGVNMDGKSNAAIKTGESDIGIPLMHFFLRPLNVISASDTTPCCLHACTVDDV